MSKSSSPHFVRPAGEVLARRLAEPRRFIQVVSGPRQVGKSTLVGQIVEQRSIPAVIASADGPARLPHRDHHLA